MSLDYPVMIDLETGGLGPNAPIAAIGAVRFTTDGTPLPGSQHELYIPVTLAGQPAPDASTMYWWMRQSDEARAAFCEGEHGGLDLFNALWKLRLWLLGLNEGDLAVDKPREFGGEVWVRGDRDSVWLEQAHLRSNMKLPYRFNKVRDQRTLVEFAIDRGVEMPEWRDGAHHALEDARYQVECLQAVWKAYPPLGDF